MFTNKLKIKKFLLCACALLMGGTLQAEEEKSPTTVDILFVFDEGAIEKLNSVGGSRNFVNRSPEEITQECIQQLNHLMSNSGLRDDVKFRCCGIFHASYRSQAGTNGQFLEKDLMALMTGQADENGTQMAGNLLSRKNGDFRPMTLREAEEFSHSDLVIMLVDFDLVRGKGCMGQAAVGRYNSLFLNTDRQKGRYSVFRMETGNSSNYVLSHELCHLFGAGHSDYQNYQRGPQAETDAAGTYAVENGVDVATLMSYTTTLDLRANEPTVLEARRDLILSNPQSREVNRNGKIFTYSVGDESSHNNAAVVRRAASSVSMYSVSGNERVINDNFNRAIALPPMKPLAEKLRMALESEAASQEGLDSTLRANWATRWDRTNNIFIRTAFENRYDRYISPEFMQESMAESLVSCVLGTNVEATRENGEPELEGGLGQTVWYSVIPPVTGKMTIGIRTLYSSHSFRPVLGVFRGESVDSLEALPHTVYSNEQDNHFYKHRIQVDVRQGEKLYIAVDSSTNIGRGFNLLVSLKADESTATAAASFATTREDKSDVLACIEAAEVSTPAAPTEATPEAAPTSDDQKNAANEVPAETAPVEQNEAAPQTAAPQSGSQKQWDTTDSVLLAIAVGFMLATILTCCNLLSATFSDSAKNKPGTNNKPKEAEKEEDNDNQVACTSAPAAPVTNDELKLIGKLSTNEQVEYTVKIQDIANKGNFYLGRAETCDLTIPDSTISRSHAVFKVRAAENGYILLIADAGSTNGTIIDDIRLTENQSLKVQNNTRINIGDCCFTISIL